MKTRDRVLTTAMRLIRSQGVAATGVCQVLSEAKAPKGSLYHHFPGGKSQLVAEALQLNADQIAESVSEIARSTSDPATALHAYAEVLAADLQTSDFRCGCPLATAVLEQAATDDAVAEISDRGFEAWREAMAAGLRRGGLEEADDLALLAVAAFEGALILARAKRDTGPVTRVAATMAALIQ